MTEPDPEQRPMYHVVSWAPDGSRTYHLIVDTLAKAVEFVRDMADNPDKAPGGEAAWVGETLRVRGVSGCRPWAQILVGGRVDTPEEERARIASLLRGVRTEREAHAGLNQGPVPSSSPLERLDDEEDGA